MADLATLKIAVDSRPVEAAANDLDALAASAGRADKAAAGLTSTTKTTSAAAAGMSNAMRQAQAAQEAAAQAMGGVAGRTKLASHEITNLAFQFQDLGVQLAGGANPLVALAQQGSQVSGIMMQSGMSVGTFSKAVVSMLGNAAKAVLLNPIFLGIAAAVGSVSLALNFMGEDIKKATGQTVTAGDIMLGTFDVIRDGISNKVTAAFKAMGYDVGDVWDNVVKFTRKAINIVIGVATLAPRMIIQAFSVLPAAIADTFYSSVNLALVALNSLIQKSVGAINSFINLVNPILEKAGLSIGNITAPRIAELQNNYAGAADKAARAFVKVATDTINRDFIGEFASVIGEAAANRAVQREAEEAGKKTGKAIAKGAGKAFKDEFAIMYDEALQEIASQMGSAGRRPPTESIDEILEAQSRARLEMHAKDAAALQSNINFATNAAADIGSLIGGSFGQGVKDLADILSRDFPKMFGDLGGMFKDVVGKIDGLLGSLGTSLKSLGQGAAIGGISASITGGSKTGGAIGGAIGGEIGSAIAGPIGKIAGSILGGIVGGLFKKTKQASATIASIGGQAVVSTITGNNAELKGAANNMAKGLLKGISDIAEQLGGTLGGAVKLSIGQRNKDFVVDPTGAGRTKGAGVINFGQDQAAAVAYVTQLAIQQGIITGISAGAQTLIKAGGELNDQVQKALKFDQVFKDLRKETDPLGASLDDLASEMAKLKAIFDEAGASAEDYAKLEELFAVRRAKAMFEAERPRRELEIALMEAQGNASAALAAKRALELEATDANLRALKEQVFAAEDAAAAQAAAAEAAANAQTEFAQKVSDAESVLRDAESVLRDAYERESGVLIDAAQRFRELGKALRDVSRDIGAMMGVGGTSAGNLRGRFFSLAASARLGDTNALEGLPALAREYADLVTETAPDRLSMIRELSAIQEQTLAAGSVADRQASLAEMQLSAMQEQVGSLITLNQTMMTVATATRQLVALNGGTPAPVASSAINQPSAVFDSNQVMTAGSNDNVRNEVSALRDEMKVALFQIAKNTGKASDQLQRWDGEGLPEARGY